MYKSQPLAAVGSLIVAIAVFVVSWRQADIMKLQAKTMERQADIMEGQQDLQRAWLIAGMGDAHRPKVDADGRTVQYCNPNFHNYGQTPAFVRYLDWNFCPDPPPKEPDWHACERNRFQINNWASPSRDPTLIEVEPSHEMTAPTVIFYGACSISTFSNVKDTVASSTAGISRARTKTAWAASIPNTLNGSRTAVRTDNRCSTEGRPLATHSGSDSECGANHGPSLGPQGPRRG